MDYWFKFDVRRLQEELASMEGNMADKGSSTDKQINTEVAGFRARKDAMHAEDGDSSKSK